MHMLLGMHVPQGSMETGAGKVDQPATTRTALRKTTSNGSFAFEALLRRLRDENPAKAEAVEVLQEPSTTVPTPGDMPLLSLAGVPPALSNLQIGGTSESPKEFGTSRQIASLEASSALTKRQGLPMILGSSVLGVEGRSRKQVVSPGVRSMAERDVATSGRADQSELADLVVEHAVESGDAELKEVPEDAHRIQSPTPHPEELAHAQEQSVATQELSAEVQVSEAILDERLRHTDGVPLGSDAEPPATKGRGEPLRAADNETADRWQPERAGDALIQAPQRERTSAATQSATAKTEISNGEHPLNGLRVKSLGAMSGTEPAYAVRNQPPRAGESLPDLTAQSTITAREAPAGFSQVEAERATDSVLRRAADVADGEVPDTARRMPADVGRSNAEGGTEAWPVIANSETEAATRHGEPGVGHGKGYPAGIYQGADARDITVSTAARHAEEDVSHFEHPDSARQTAAPTARPNATEGARRDGADRATSQVPESASGQAIHRAYRITAGGGSEPAADKGTSRVPSAATDKAPDVSARNVPHRSSQATSAAGWSDAADSVSSHRAATGNDVAPLADSMGDPGDKVAAFVGGEPAHTPDHTVCGVYSNADEAGGKVVHELKERQVNPFTAAPPTDTTVTVQEEERPVEPVGAGALHLVSERSDDFPSPFRAETEPGAVKFSAECDDIGDEVTDRTTHGDSNAEPLESELAEAEVGDHRPDTSESEGRPAGGQTQEASPNTAQDAQFDVLMERSTTLADGRARSVQRTPSFTALAEPDSLADVIRTVSFEHDNQTQAIRVDLQPREMGRLHLRVAAESGSVSVYIMAESESTARVLEAALPQLRHLLDAGGLSVGTLEVHVGTGNGGFGHSEDLQARQAPMRVRGRTARVGDAAYASSEPLAANAYDRDALVNVLA